MELNELDDNPNTRYFFLRNRDPKNQVLHKDFYLYSILMIYIFYFWYIVSVFENEEFLDRSNYGKAIFGITTAVAAGTGLVILSMIFNQYKYPNDLAGIVFILLLISMGITLFNFDLREIDPRFERDPSSLSAAFLIAYSFVSYFFIR